MIQFHLVLIIFIFGCIYYFYEGQREFGVHLFFD